MAKKVYAKLEVDFNSNKRERCCKLDIHGPKANLWEDLESKVLDSIKNTLDRRIQFYEDEIRKLNEQRLMPIWNFYNFFILKKILSFCTREIWIITACLGLINATASHYSDGLVAPDIEKEFFQGDLYSLYRTKGGGKDGANKCSEPESAPSTNVVTSLPETETAHTIASTSLSETKSAGKGTSSLPKTERSCNLDSFSINETERAYNVASAFLADVKNDRAPNITCSIESQKILSTTSHLVHCNSNAAESSNDDVMDGADPGNN